MSKFTINNLNEVITIKYSAKCAKDILLFVQDNAPTSLSKLTIDQYQFYLPQYSKQEIMEHILYLNEIGIFKRVVCDDFNNVYLTLGLTNKGQHFAIQLSNDTFWKKFLQASKDSLPDLIKLLIL